MSAPASSSKPPLNPFSVGALVMSNGPPRAGCSSYPTFGVITKITPAGKWRIAHVAKERYDHPTNSFDQSGSKHAVRPNASLPASDKTWLARDEPSDHGHPPHDYIVSGSKHDWQTWLVYDSSQIYYDHYDNGD